MFHCTGFAIASPLASFWRGDPLRLRSSAQAASRSKVTIDRSVTIVESADEPGPVRRATEDLLNDFGKVLGQTPNLANHMEGSGQVAILISRTAEAVCGYQVR